ncbi:hypothetical protein ID866_6915 [Astraeus odoratus]|nr:hypothetical protein ID866_6915 [Astraeus odoratus]
MPSNRNKALPALPSGIETSASEGAPFPHPFSRSTAHVSKSLPTVRAEEVLSKAEMENLRDCWNADVYRKRQLGQHMKFSPPPITLPDAVENIPPSGLSAPVSASSISRSQKLRGFFRGRNLPTSPTSQKIPSALQCLKHRAEQNLRKRLKNAISTPDLKDRVKATTQAEARDVPPVPPLTTAMQQATAMAHEDLVADDAGIYLTIESDWRNSRGEMMLTFLSPIPQDYDPFRPDSPILHRHRSLCDLETLTRAPPENGVALGPLDVHPIDELHSFLILVD